MEPYGDRSFKSHSKRKVDRSHSPAFGKRELEEEKRRFASQMSKNKPVHFGDPDGGQIDEAIQLVAIDDHGICKINPRALNIIK